MYAHPTMDLEDLRTRVIEGASAEERKLALEKYTIALTERMKSLGLKICAACESMDAKAAECDNILSKAEDVASSSKSTRSEKSKREINLLMRLHEVEDELFKYKQMRSAPSSSTTQSVRASSAKNCGEQSDKVGGALDEDLKSDITAVLLSQGFLMRSKDGTLRASPTRVKGGRDRSLRASKSADDSSSPAPSPRRMFKGTASAEVEDTPRSIPSYSAESSNLWASTRDALGSLTERARKPII